MLPLREMAENFGLVRKSMRPKLGHKSFFTLEGKARAKRTEIVHLLRHPHGKRGAVGRQNRTKGTFGDA